MLIQCRALKVILYFDWDCNCFQRTAFCYVETESGVQPSPYRSYGLPQDFVDLSTGSDPYKLMDLLQLVRSEML